jgi:hypothetical protein
MKELSKAQTASRWNNWCEVRGRGNCSLMAIAHKEVGIELP